jgi:hypothetical protein
MLSASYPETTILSRLNVTVKISPFELWHLRAQLNESSELSWDGVPPIAVVIAVAAMMVLISVLNAAEVGALTDICPTVFASAFSYTIFPE